MKTLCTSTSAKVGITIKVGTIISELLTIIYMNYLEYVYFIHQSKLMYSVCLYARYVDDISILTICKEADKISKIYQQLNNIDTHIRLKK